MVKTVSIKHLQDAGFLSAEYTGLDLCDAFLMYWISHSGADKDHIVLCDGNYTLDIGGYFRFGSSGFRVHGSRLEVAGID
jgi:hypothetical protein